MKRFFVLTRFFVLIVGLILLGSVHVSAADNGNRKPDKRPNCGPCQADVKALCSSVPQGEGRILNCLMDHYTELSEACGAKVKKMKAKKPASSA